MNADERSDSDASPGAVLSGLLMLARLVLQGGPAHTDSRVNVLASSWESSADMADSQSQERRLVAEAN